MSTKQQDYDNLDGYKEAEPALSESDETIRLIIENAKNIAIFTLDPNGYVTSWNAGAKNIKGYEASEIIGRHYSIFYPPEQQAQGLPIKALKLALERGRYEHEGWRIKKDGTRFWASVAINPIYDHEGRHIGFSKFMRDMTQRKQDEDEIQRQTNYLRLTQDIAEAANRANSVEEAMSYSIRRICEFSGWELGHVYRVAENGTDRLISMGIWYAVYPNRYKEFCEITESRTFTAGNGLPGMVLVNSLPLWLSELEVNPLFNRQQAAKAAKLETALAFPVLIGERVAGVLEFFTSEKVEPDSQFIQVMGNIGTQLGRVVERKRAEEALRQSEGRFRTIFSGAPLGVETVDIEGRLLESNPALSTLLGYTPDELKKLSAEDPHHPANLVSGLALFESLRRGECESFIVEKEFLRKDGRKAWGRIFASLHRDPEGDPQFVILMVEDITERKEMESELAELYNRMEESREAERLHLAQELHDGPIQELYGLTYQLKIAEGEPDKLLTQATNEARTNINRIVRTLRAITGELRPPALAPFGLEKAIQSHIGAISEAHLDLEVDLDLTPDGQRLPENIRLALFRIYQSMISNVIRHSNASRVSIRFKIQGDTAELTIEDNGKGFVMPKRRIQLAREGHLGLIGAVERTEALGGQLIVDSKPGTGTKIKVSIPVPKTMPEQASK